MTENASTGLPPAGSRIWLTRGANYNDNHFATVLASDSKGVNLSVERANGAAFVMYKTMERHEWLFASELPPTKMRQCSECCIQHPSVTQTVKFGMVCARCAQ